MRKLLVAALVICCTACADTGSTSDKDIHGSRFIYDPSAKPIVVSGGSFIYDPAAPELHASRFVIESNP